MSTGRSPEYAASNAVSTLRVRRVSPVDQVTPKRADIDRRKCTRLVTTPPMVVDGFGSVRVSGVRLRSGFGGLRDDTVSVFIAVQAM